MSVTTITAETAAAISDISGIREDQYAKSMELVRKVEEMFHAGAPRVALKDGGTIVGYLYPDGRFETIVRWLAP